MAWIAGKPGGGLMGMCHSPVGGILVPVRMGSWFPSVMSTLVDVKVAVSPASHIWPMDKRDPDPESSSWKMWA